MSPVAQSQKFNNTVLLWGVTLPCLEKKLCRQSKNHLAFGPSTGLAFESWNETCPTTSHSKD